MQLQNHDQKSEFIKKTYQLKQPDTPLSATYPEFAAKAQLLWSLNVHKEYDGALADCVGVLISLAIWLEFYLTQQQQESTHRVHASHHVVLKICKSWQ